MRDLVKQFLDHDISRRQFAKGLTSLGLSTAAVQSVVGSIASAAEPIPRDGIKVEGTGAEILWETLIAADVKYVFGTTATGMSPIFDAMTIRPGPTWIMSIAESQATAMAHGYELASQTPGVLLVPGVAIPSTMNMLYNAWKDRSSLVVFSDGPSGAIPFRNMFQQMEDWVEPMIQFTKWRWKLDDPRHISEISRRAIKLAQTAPGGPVHVRIPLDVLGTKKVRQTIYPQSRFTIPVEMRPKPELIEATAKAFLEAKKPIITVGSEVSRAGANRELVELAELLGIPVAQGYSVYGDFPFRNPLWAGFHGLGAPRGAMAGADVFMSLGIQMPGPGIFTSPPPRSAKIIEARVEYQDIGMTYPTDIAIAAGVKETIVDLTDAIKSMATAERLEKISAPRLAAAREEQAIRDTARRDEARAMWDSSPMSWARLSAELDQGLDEDAIVVPELDYRTPLHWLDFNLGRKKVIGQTTGFALGWGIAAAEGVKIAEPDRQVVCLVGDGALLFGEIESLWAASRYEIPIIIVVTNNQSYDNERNRLQDRSPLYTNKNTREQWKDITGYLGNPDVDFAGLAKSFAIAGERAETPADFRKALKRARSATREGRPYLIDAMIMQVEPVRSGANRGSYVKTEQVWYPDVSIARGRSRKV
jgi:thiamine pyrophosphate-dependent acetolactate synthase large subunit-like protein